MTAMRLISSEMPWTNSSTKPISTSDLAGHCGSPPALHDCSLSRNGSQEERHRVTIMMIVNGSRKNSVTDDVDACRAHRFGNMLFTMSMRMCSLDKQRPWRAQQKNDAEQIHCSSSQEFEDVSNTLRMVALVAE